MSNSTILYNMRNNNNYNVIERVGKKVVGQEYILKIQKLTN